MIGQGHERRLRMSGTLKPSVLISLLFEPFLRFLRASSLPKLPVDAGFNSVFENVDVGDRSITVGRDFDHSRRRVSQIVGITNEIGCGGVPRDEGLNATIDPSTVVALILKILLLILEN